MKKDKQKRGRPFKSNAEKLSGIQVTFSLSPAYRNRIDAIIQTTGENKATLFRRLIDNEARRLALTIAQAEKEKLHAETPAPTDKRADDRLFSPELENLSKEIETAFDTTALDEFIRENGRNLDSLMKRFVYNPFDD